MKSIAIFVILVALLVGCQDERKTEPQQRLTAQSQSEWKEGDVVELTGIIYPAKTDVKYFIETDDGRGAGIRSEAIDKLEAGTRVWVKGKIEYVHVPKPKDYENPNGTVNYGVKLPQTFCYIKVSDFEILTPQQSSGE